MRISLNKSHGITVFKQDPQKENLSPNYHPKTPIKLQNNIFVVIVVLHFVEGETGTTTSGDYRIKDGQKEQK